MICFACRRLLYLLSLSSSVQDNADPVLLGDHDVALASIEKVVAGKTSDDSESESVHLFCFSCVLRPGAFSVSVGPSRTKLVTSNSSLKFTPEELVLYCRDLRVLCFLFDRLTPDAQAVEVREQSKPSRAVARLLGNTIRTRGKKCISYMINRQTNIYLVKIPNIN